MAACKLVPGSALACRLNCLEENDASDQNRTSICDSLSKQNTTLKKWREYFKRKKNHRIMDTSMMFTLKTDAHTDLH